MKKYIVVVFLLIAQISISQKINFDANWKFMQQDEKGAESILFNDANWRILNVPHDWSIEGEYDEKNPMGDQCGYLPAGIGWYRKTVEVLPEWKGKHIEISFDGVYRNSTVWVNGVELGHRPYGWISFCYDISEIVKTSKKITIAVRVDNEKQPAARWYTGSGIYGHTWLVVKDKLHIVTDGVFVRTEGDLVKIDTEIENKSLKKANLILKSTILDASGKVVAVVENNSIVDSEEKLVVPQIITVKNPNLWSIENPYLYTLKSEVFEGNVVKHTIETRFGIRDIEWVGATGMWINGKNVKMQGVSNHQDAGALGAAVPDKIIRFRIEQLKKMGVNAIRLAHNPQTPIFYDICDEVGMLVMDEIFDGWEKKAAEDYGSYAFDAWWKIDITDWIKRDRNHPSVVIYSVGNETHGEVAKDLVALCHQLDATRPVTSGHSQSEYMDVFGVNGHSEKKGFFEELVNEKRVFIGTENTHTWQVRGYYRTKTWFRDGFPNERQKPYELPDLTEKEVFSHDWVSDGDRTNKKQLFNSSYDNAMVRVSSRLNIEQLRDIPKYAGSFRWTGHDYIGEAGYVHGGWPFKSFMGGAIDMANFEKDLYYLYQSQWTTTPMVHILPHWTHPKITVGTKIPVWVYSNCDEVELFLNNTSLGKIKPGKKWNEMQCQWMVPYKEGTLKAVGFINGNVVSEKTIRTATSPSKIKISVDGEPLSSKGKDIVQVRVTSTDEKGEMYPYGENRTFFHVFGPAKIKALDNGSPVDVEKHFEAIDRIAFYGLTRAYVESSEKEGAITLLASSILGEKKQITSKKVSIDTQLFSLRGEVPKMKIDVFYTLDGSKPTVHSKKYIKSFEVELGTTVKAVVVVNGKLVHYLHERFASDEGFVWNEIKEGNEVIGEQAEDAMFEGATIDTKGNEFNGKGYLKFNKTIGSFVEWYQENDGGEGVANMFIKYSGNFSGAAGTFIKITNNGKVIEEKFFLRNARNWGGEWNKAKVPFQLQRGANTIKITTLEDKGLLIDEILIK